MSSGRLLIFIFYNHFFTLCFSLYDMDHNEFCGGAKTWALAVGLSTTFYQQCIRGEEIIWKPRN